ncbi:MAG: beta-galactosidase [Streptosporangiaceae bacterium]|nr:beta-galactosidase [Streptosporangiaceae bacterium]MBV9854421.1 beta-galactosidase [Streptosporangiaceae bacterium]
MSAAADPPGGGPRPAASRAGRFWDRLGHLGYGADYNPEQWPPGVWREDMKLMREAGVNMVSVAIFGWAQLEPRPGHYEFGWLDEVLGLLHENGISACLATATASPPPWLARLYPQTLPETADGTRLMPGSRQHFCPSSPEYRAAAAALVERLARRYSAHPALAVWHVGNEFGCHVPACYCDRSAADFRRWLRDRYGDLDTLNERWSTAFWSQRYGEWEEIGVPRRMPAFANPAQQLDFARFCSDALLACFTAEREILRSITPGIPVTTNFLSLWKPVDFFAWAPHQDVIAHDSYPDPLDPATVSDAAFNYDLMRSLGGGRPWILMEQAPSAVNWRGHNAPKPPGVMRLWSYQALARGADAIMFFQWRASAGGAEKFHSALLPHGGTATRTWREASALGRELRKLGELRGTRVRADVAIMLDWPSWWALEQDSHPSQALLLTDQLRAHYKPLWEASIAADVVHPESSLAGYRLVVVPNLYLVTVQAVTGLHDYVSGGGHLLMSFFSGIVDENDRVRLGGYPAPFTDLLGLRIGEFWPLAPGVRAGAEFHDGQDRFTASFWADAIELAGAEPVASYRDGELSGVPALTRHRFGDGLAWYLGTRPGEAAMRRIVLAAARAAGAGPPVPGLPPGVEAVRRAGPRGSYLLLLNHSGDQADIGLPVPMADLLGAPGPRARILLPARGVAVLREPSHPKEP